MPQPEASFKRRLIESFERFVPNGWYTYLAHGGPGQKPGLNDLLFGVRLDPQEPRGCLPDPDCPWTAGTPRTLCDRARPLLYVEAKMWPIDFQSTQLPVLNALQACGAAVRVVALEPLPRKPRHVRVYGRVTPTGVGAGAIVEDFKTASFWDTLWGAAA